MAAWSPLLMAQPKLFSTILLYGTADGDEVLEKKRLSVSVWPRHIESAGMQCEDGVHQQMRWTPWKKSNARHGANTVLS